MPPEARSRSPRFKPLNLGPYGATEFQVNFAARSAVGTYSYAISPAISDRIRTSITIGRPGGAPLPPFNSSDGPIPLQPFNTSTNTPGVIVSPIQITNASLTQPGRQQPHGHGEHHLDQR